VVSHTPFLQATTHAVTVSVCVPFGVKTTQPDAFGADSVPIVDGIAGHALYVVTPGPAGRSSAVAQIGGVGHVGHAGVTSLVSGTGGGKITI
jgi:hypothetical protein